MFVKTVAGSTEFKVSHSVDSREDGSYLLKIDDQWEAVAYKTATGFETNFALTLLMSSTMKELKMKFAFIRACGEINVYTKKRNTILCTRVTRTTEGEFEFRQI